MKKVGEVRNTQTGGQLARTMTERKSDLARQLLRGDVAPSVCNVPALNNLEDDGLVRRVWDASADVYLRRATPAGLKWARSVVAEGQR